MMVISLKSALIKRPSWSNFGDIHAFIMLLGVVFEITPTPEYPFFVPKTNGFDIQYRETIQMEYQFRLLLFPE